MSVPFLAFLACRWDGSELDDGLLWRLWDLNELEELLLDGKGPLLVLHFCCDAFIGVD